MCLKAHPLLREIVVREGMPAYEDGKKEKTLQSDGTKITECTTIIRCSERCEFGHTYSSFQFIAFTSHNQFT